MGNVGYYVNRSPSIARPVNMVVIMGWTSSLDVKKIMHPERRRKRLWTLPFESPRKRMEE